MISGTTSTTNGYNAGATLELNEPTSIITDDQSFGVNVGGSVWYIWTAPASGNVTFSTIGSSFDTILAAYTGNGVANLTLLAANDDISTTNVQSLIGFYAVANTTYFIGVYGFDAPPVTQGNVVLNWNLQTPGFPLANSASLLPVIRPANANLFRLKAAREWVQPLVLVLVLPVWVARRAVCRWLTP